MMTCHANTEEIARQLLLLCDADLWCVKINSHLQN